MGNDIRVIDDAVVSMESSGRVIIENLARGKRLYGCFKQCFGNLMIRRVEIHNYSRLIFLSSSLVIFTIIL